MNILFLTCYTYDTFILCICNTNISTYSNEFNKLKSNNDVMKQVANGIRMCETH